MKPHVKHVIDLWKASSETKSQIMPYKMSQQLRTMASLFSPGAFYYYILDFPNVNIEYMHEGTKEILGLEPEEVSMEKLIEILAPDEQEPMAKKEAVVVDFFFNYLNPEDILFYKAVYFVRIEDTQGKLHDILHQATVLSMTEDNKAEHVLVLHTDVSHLNFQRKNTVSFISLNGGKSYFDVDAESGYFDSASSFSQNLKPQVKFTKREKEIIKLIAQGNSSKEIAHELHISVHTLHTHRKNILKKSNCTNTAQLVSQCLIEGVI